MPLELEQKRKLTEALNAWLDDKNPARSANKLSEKTGVSNAYLSHLKAGQFEVKTNKGVTVIKDAYFERVADAIDVQLSDRLHWDFVHNYKRIRRACAKAQQHSIRMVIDGWTRMGKTHSLEKYAAQNDYVLYVKCTQNMSSKDLLEEILSALGVHDNIRGNHRKLKTIRQMITNRKGYLIIIDEVEVVKPGIYGVIKDISDWANGKAGFVICGMDIISKLDKLASAHKAGFPQLRGRFFGNKVLAANNLSQEEIVHVCEFEKITNRGAQNVLAKYAEDLDMLAQYVADIKAWQDKNGKKITGDEAIQLLDLNVSTFNQRAA